MKQSKPPIPVLLASLLGLVVLPQVLTRAQQNVVQPGDPIIASSSNSPGSEGVANAIDAKPTKYLNFDAANNAKTAGFIVTPSVGPTRVTGLAMESANDAPDRDPKKVTLEGSNDDTPSYTGNWELIVTIDNIPAYTNRFETQTFSFPNTKPFKSYRWTVVETQGPSTCCFQIAEVQLLGGPLPPNVVQPGDPVIASSSNSPGSEGVANAIDAKPTKYLNFDSANDAKTAGFVVTPSVGPTVVTGLTMESANDAPDRDPKEVTLEGSNDDTASYTGSWELITTITNIPAFANRFETKTFLFDNIKPYKSYRWTVVHTQGPSTCCFQIAEVGFLGGGAPQNVAQPGDPVIASSSNSPGSEGVANAIDGKPTKYLNFDSANDAKLAGFIVTPSVGATTVTGLAMESANDAPDRDPKEVNLEGSNDDTPSYTGNWEMIANIKDIPAYTNRFQTQTFYFPNQKTFKSYRWTVVHTQGPSTCCFQIAEVQFLAVTTGADCNKARFLVQPVDTPALQGSSATFFTTVNGPWPLQWLMNGTPIPGATKNSFTTDPITTANATNQYSVKIVGCETSVVVRASLFTPSTVKSIGISYIGGGANGAPTSMNTNDIAGLQPQAYWNNANAGSGELPDSSNPDVPFTDSDNKPTTVTFTWETSGTWGAGTGTDSATQRMLNGLDLANPGTPATFTFSNVPDGAHAIILYVVSPPLQFQNVTYKVTGTTEQTYYIRAMNSDEYNAAPGFYRGTSTNAANATIADYVRFDNVHPTAGTITVTVDCTTTGYDRGTGVNAIQLILNAPAPGAPPAITTDPQPTVVQAGGTAKLSVAATGDSLTYQWRKNGRNLPNGGTVSGATTANLTITSFDPTDEGIYSVAVFNPAGSTISKNAALRLSAFNIQDRLAGYWKLDETSGTTAANSATNGKPGKVTGTATWGKGQVANALTFDGSSTYVMVDDYTKATTQIGASAWVNVGANAAATDISVIRNGLGAIVRQSANVGQFELGLVVNTTDNSLQPMAAIRVGPNVVRITGTAPFPKGSWHHLAFSADGAQIRLYVDGAEVAASDYLGDIPAPSVPWLSIGAQLNVADASDPASPVGPDPTTPNFLAGQLDELALWDRALAADEVSKLFDAGKAGQPLTSIELTPPTGGGGGGTLTVTAKAGQVTVTWDKGSLQTAGSITGPWTDSTAQSPLTEAASGSAKFYRTKQ